MNEVIAVSIARLEEKYKNLLNYCSDLKERNRYIQADLIKKSEEIKEVTSQNRILEKELKRTKEDLLKELQSLDVAFKNISNAFKELHKNLENEIMDLQTYKQDATLIYAKIILYALGGIGAIIGLFFSTGIIKF